MSTEDQYKQNSPNSSKSYKSQVVPLQENVQLDITNNNNQKINEKGVDISFNNLTYSVQIKKHNQQTGKKEQINKKILDNLNGICKAGEITAIMGSSGAGKTSLLNILCKRVQKTAKNNLSGEINANQEEYSYEQFSNFASYIMQDDRLLETMTIYECLLFAARLKVQGTKKEQEDRVDTVIRQLKLQKSKDTVIGGDFLKGISGGERKRCSIGFELISNPDVLFLDEPTSGLDSFTAFIVINQLKQLAKEQNKNIIFTIHQPSSDIWHLFNRVFFLVDGKFIYQGKGGLDVVNHFANIGFQCPQQSNPADYLIQIMKKNDARNQNNFQTYFQGYSDNLAAIVDKEINEKRTTPIKKDIIRASPIEEIKQIKKRTLNHMKKNPLLIKARMGQTIFISLFTSAIYFNLNDGTDDPTNLKDINNFVGFFFFQSITMFMLSLSPVVLTFPTERGVFLKEENGKLYRILPYFIGRTMLEFPFLILFAIIQSTILYFMVGLRSSEQVYFQFVVTNIILSFTGNSIGLIIGSSFSDTKVASGMMPLCVIPYMLFGGFYSNRESLWDGIAWIEYLSPFKYGFDAHINNNFEETNFRPNPIDMFNLDLGFTNSMIIMVVLFVVYRLIAFTLLYIFKKRLQ